MGSNTPRGHTGSKVQEPGTYRAADSGQTWTYMRGDQFVEDPRTHKPTTWVKTFEADHPGGSR